MRLNLLALAMTLAAVGVAVLAMIAVAALGHLEALLPTLPGWVAVVGKLLSYLLLACAGAAGAATLYRYGPSRDQARWVWLTPGSAFAAVFWLGLTIGFGIYVANFGNYDATYGSLGTVVVLLTWLYLSSYILLFGAELNSEFEHQTATDTTRGADKPLGARGAWVADHVAEDGSPSEQSTSNSPIAKEEPGMQASMAPCAASPNLATTLVTAQATRAAGFGKVGMVTTALATIGLGKLRTRGQARAGIVLLAMAGGLSWLRKPRM